MKDKPANKVTMNDILHEYRLEDEKEPSVVDKQLERKTSSLSEEAIPSDYLVDLANYNELLRTSLLDNNYAKVKPLHNVLVRVFVREPLKTESGLLRPYKKIVPIPTKAGYGEWAEVESPYPYDTLAIVVAKPDSITNINVGDTIVLGKDPVDAKVVGQADSAYISIPNAFTLPDWKEETPPKDPKNPHYGYLLLPVYEIKCIL